MKMKSVKVEDAVGMVLAHDLTKVVPGTFKGAAFKKGHIIREEDIEELKNMGKNHIFAVSLNESEVHENEAARRIAEAASSGEIYAAEALEGKSNMRAAKYGLLKVNIKAMEELNQIGKIALVSLHNNTLVKKDQIVAAAKIIPLTAEREDIEKAEQICRQHAPVIDIKPLYCMKTGIIVTGSEVYYGRIRDKFGGLLQEKVRYYGGEPLDILYAPDDSEHIYRLILESIEKGAEIVLISGGMAVDADDVSPKAIRDAASEIITYGLPLLPGAMCMVAYRHQVPIVGIPACAMYHKTTVLDIIFPRLLTKDKWTRKDLVSLAHGGICLQCETCHYPVCPFGK